MNRRGELTTQEILEIILAGAAVLLMGFLLYRLISPSFDVNDETAKAYFDSFMDAIKVADSDGDGVFSMWQPEGDVSFHVVYFGGRRSVARGERGEMEFFSFGKNENHVCLCYIEEGESECGYCENLKYPATYDDGQSDLESEKWAFGSQNRVEIIKREDVYEIVRK